MSFKDQLAKDIQSTFINPNEFATLHTINDRQIWAVVEANQAGSNIQGLRSAQPPTYAEGVYVSQKIIHVDQTEFGGVPREHEEMKFDGARYLVTGVKVEDGILTILLEAYKS